MKDWLAIVQKNSFSLHHVPPELKNKQICLEAVIKNGDALKFVPFKLKTKDLCLVAVKQSGNALKYVPSELKTTNLCLAAMKQNGNALIYVPDELKTKKMCLAAVKQNGYVVSIIPGSERNTYEIWFEAVKQNGHVLYFVPSKFKTKDLCLAAIKQNGYELKHVPSEFKTEDLCLAAVQNSGFALEYVPPELRTKNLCLTCFTIYGKKYKQNCLPTVNIFNCIPELTIDMLRMAIIKYPFLINYIMDKYDNDVIYVCILNSIFTFGYNKQVHTFMQECVAPKIEQGVMQEKNNKLLNQIINNSKFEYYVLASIKIQKWVKMCTKYDVRYKKARLFALEQINNF